MLDVLRFDTNYPNHSDVDIYPLSPTGPPVHVVYGDTESPCSVCGHPTQWVMHYQDRCLPHKAPVCGFLCVGNIIGSPKASVFAKRLTISQTIPNADEVLTIDLIPPTFPDTQWSVHWGAIPYFPAAGTLSAMLDLVWYAKEILDALSASKRVL
jgi:hypothetical protein